MAKAILGTRGIISKFILLLCWSFIAPKSVNQESVMEGKMFDSQPICYVGLQQLLQRKSKYEVSQSGIEKIKRNYYQSEQNAFLSGTGNKKSFLQLSGLQEYQKLNQNISQKLNPKLNQKANQIVNHLIKRLYNLQYEGVIYGHL